MLDYLTQQHKTHSQKAVKTFHTVGLFQAFNVNRGICTTYLQSLFYRFWQL